MSVFDKINQFLRPSSGALGGNAAMSVGSTTSSTTPGVMAGNANAAAQPMAETSLSPSAMADRGNQAELARLALNNIRDAVIMTDAAGVIRFINSAAIVMTGCGRADDVVGLDYGLVLRLANAEGAELSAADDPLAAALRAGQLFNSRDLMVISLQDNKRFPVALSLLVPMGGSERIITFRDITEELKAEGEQSDFVSTASHEMRTPVAAIEGFLGLALNPQTATIDERARGYITKAHDASRHLGQLFQNLLDVTKLDDRRLKPQLTPLDVSAVLRSVLEGYGEQCHEKNLTVSFGPDGLRGDRRMEQPVYAYLDETFLREIVGNLIENAIKYTPEGGSIWVNARGDGDRLLINVTDSGIGISQDDLAHIFQKFYRADNSQTRTSSGTGLGLYLVRQRTEALGGKVWAESSFGEGSTFYVSLPRISAEEYEKRRLALENSPIVGVVPSGAAPSGAIPSGAVPSGAAPNGAVPSGAVPNMVAGDATAAPPITDVNSQSMIQ